MKRTKVDGALERQFLIGFVTSKEFLAHTVRWLDEDHLPLIGAKYAQQIARWCANHYRRFGDAPGRAIEAVYHSWVEHEKPEVDEAEAVGDFLGILSEQADGEPVPLNAPHLAEELSKYITSRKLRQLADAITVATDYGQLEQARQAVQSFRTVEVGEKSGYVIDKQAIREVFADPLQTVIKYAGDAGKFFNPELTRDALIGIQAGEKMGKSFWVQEFATRGLRTRSRVAWFQLGDLSKKQHNHRLLARMAGVPMRASQCAEVKLPSSLTIVKGPDGRVADVQYTPMSFPGPLDEQLAKQGRKMFFRRLKMEPEDMRLSVHAISTLNVAGANAILKRWKDEDGFVPDVILMDYADIMAPESTRDEPKNYQNETWKALRRMSQEWNACVISPTQANAATYTTKTQGRNNFSQDKRKYAHVTAMLGLNQTPAEYKQQVQRLNWIMTRDGSYGPTDVLWVTRCLPLGQAMVQATF